MSTLSEDGEKQLSQAVLEDFIEAGVKEKEVEININFDIIQQVSSQLYTNPRRAVEELVCNSYDAGTTECYVTTPDAPSDVLRVLDNGVSMDDDGLEWLWQIADSPKRQLKEDDAPRILNGRQQIGKFGVGKLAAFALGNELAHVATRNGITRIVNVSQSEIEGHDTDSPPICEIYRMPEDEARDHLGAYLDDIPDPWDQGSESWDSWTLAVVDDINEDSAGRNLKAEYLNRMLSTAIPLSTQFTIHLNGREIEERDPESDILVNLDVSEDEDFRSNLQKELKAFWVDWSDQYDEEDDVPTELYECDTTTIEDYEQDENDDTESRDALRVPRLGPVAGGGAIYETSLTSGKREDRDLSDEGYRVKVKGKLLNRGQPLFGTKAKSHKFWNRFLAEIEVPELDDDILVQRDSVNESSPRPDLTRTVLDRIFNDLRTRASSLEEEDDLDPGSFGDRLNTLSPFKAPKALQGLSEEGEFPDKGLEDVDVEMVELGRSNDAVDYSSSDETIYINDDHPLFDGLKNKDSPTSLQKVIGEALAGSLLAMGYLSYNDVREDLIQDGKEVSEMVLRSAALYIEDEVKYHIRELDQTSYEGDTPFEQAIVDAMRSMGLATRHEGGSGDSDGILEISRPGQPNFRISIEAKGSGDTVDHSDVKIGTVRDHMKKDDCDYAVVIAREFQLDGQGADEDSNLLDQITDDDYADVSLLQLDALKELLKLHRKRGFTFDQVLDIFQNEKHPDDHVDHVQDVWREMPAETGLVRAVLEASFRVQNDEDVNKPAVGMILRDEEIRDMGEVKEADIVSILSAASADTTMVQIDEEGRYYSINQRPDQIIEEMGRSGSVDE